MFTEIVFLASIGGLVGFPGRVICRLAQTGNSESQSPICAPQGCTFNRNPVFRAANK